MSKALAEFIHLPGRGFQSACDLNLPLLLGAVMLGGLAATLVFVGLLYLRGRKARKASQPIC